MNNAHYIHHSTIFFIERIHYIFFVMLGLLFLGYTHIAHAQNNAYLIEGESFQFKGKWFAEKDREALGGTLLRYGAGKADSLSDALTVVNIREAGNYTVWIRTRDFAEKPSTRQFQLRIDDHTCERAGKHGKVGFYWEKVAQIPLEKKDILLRLHNFNYGRCDAILLIKDEQINPNEMALIDIGKWRKNPAAMVRHDQDEANDVTYLSVNDKNKVVASIENGLVRTEFLQLTDRRNAIVCRTSVRHNNQWQQVQSESLENHKIFLLYTDSTHIEFSHYFPSWSPGMKSESYFEFEGKRYKVTAEGDDQNPFRAASLSEAIPFAVEQLDKHTVSVQYITRNNSTITGMWHLDDYAQHIRLRLICKTAQPGYYSMVVAAFNPLREDKMSNVLLPPMYQYKRVSAKPQLLPSAMTQQPLAIAETTNAGAKWSSFVTADIDAFKNDWGNSDYSPIGFSIKNAQNQVQPTAFAPILGMPDSKYKEGELIDRQFNLGILPAGWEKTLTYISDSLYKVNDYRSQPQLSLTDAIFNMVDLVKDENFGGWDKQLKGFYDIEGDPETAPTVVNATPLANISLALLSKSEELYVSRALPTIEYTLSRSGYRWAVDVVPTGYNNKPEKLEFDPYTSQFTTSYYQGLHQLMNGLNPWLKSIALPGDTLRRAIGYSTGFIPWVQAMAAYKMTNDLKWLALAKENADRYIAHQIYTNTKSPLRHTPFYNSSFYAPWWHLVDLYELTKDRKYLDAAIYGSYFTIAGVRSFPLVNDSLMTIHPGNTFEGNTKIWWKGKEQYRLGFPRKEGDAPERKVPAWLVSPVGLGFEQPSTYFLTSKNKNVRPVFMSSWAPHLLRLFRYSNNKIFETYARNAVIGRFTNYPGYYATGYTDITLQPDFPYKGPDVSSIYYHHIPPHLGFSLDYLISEAVQRSKGNVEFPYSNQEGFVWFANRIYGSEGGKIFDDEHVSIWLKKGLVHIPSTNINYVTAVSEDKFWILCSSESSKEETVDIRWSAETNAITDGEIKVMDENRSPSTLSARGSSTKINIPAKGFRALAIPLLHTYKSPTYTPLADGLQMIDAGKPWGKVYFFRIRSPFGWDSIYGFAQTSPLKDVSVTVTCNGKSQQINQYPFEWSFYKLKMDETAEITLQLKDATGRTISKKITMHGK